MSGLSLPKSFTAIDMGLSSGTVSSVTFSTCSGCRSHTGSPNRPTHRSIFFSVGSP